MQIHSKKVVGATWCPMQTGPAGRWMGGERQGGGRGEGEYLTPSYPNNSPSGGFGRGCGRVGGPPYVVGSRSKQKR